MRWRRFFVLFLAAAGFASLDAGAQTDLSVPDGLWLGRIGSLELGMSQREVESLLQRHLEFDSEFFDRPSASYVEPADLRSLGIDEILGISPTAADLQFDSPLARERHLRAVHVRVRPGDCLEFARRLGFKIPIEPDQDWSEPAPPAKDFDAPYRWGLLASQPGLRQCHLYLVPTGDRSS